MLQPPTLPIGARAINALGRVAGAVGLQKDLSEAALLDQARRSTGLDDFGSSTFLDGFRSLLDSLNTEAHLTTIGRLIARGDILMPVSYTHLRAHET